jgi:hypothetical protein
MKQKGDPGLYAAIHAKRERIKAGSGERMRKPGSKGAPTAQSFIRSAKTASRKSKR